MNGERDERGQSRVARLEELPDAVTKLLTAAIVSDSLDASGVRGQVMHGRIAPISPGSRDMGRARTVQFAPSELDSDDLYGRAMSFIDSLTPGSVAVVATAEDERTAY